MLDKFTFVLNMSSSKNKDVIIIINRSFGSFIGTESGRGQALGWIRAFLGHISQMARSQTRFQSHQGSLRALCWARSVPHLY